MKYIMIKNAIDELNSRSDTAEKKLNIGSEI